MGLDNYINRREFIKNTGYISALGLLFDFIPGFTKIYEEDKYKIRVAIVGVGSRGKYLLETLKLNPQYTITALCDNYEPHLNHAKKIHPEAELFNSFSKLISKKVADAIVIATPLHEHARMTVEALQNGYHVFCEKAMAMTIEECKTMVEAHKRTNKVLLIGHQRRYSPVYLEAYKMLQGGFLGDITQVRAYWHRNRSWRREVDDPKLERKLNWRLYKEYSLGLMTELASHQIHVANWFIEQKPLSVSGAGSINYWKDGREVYDNVNLIYKYPKGVSLVYDSILSNKHYGIEEQIMGPKGTFELEKGKYFTESPPEIPGFQKLLNDIEHKIFDPIPLGGPTWVPDLETDWKGDYFINKKNLSDGSDFQFDAFAKYIKDDNMPKMLIEEAYYASVSSILGHYAIAQNEIITWEESFNL